MQAAGGVIMRKMIAGLMLLLCSSAALPRPFSFVAYGDTGYMLPRDSARVSRLIGAINRANPAFAVHVGDFKGYTSCSNAAYQKHYGDFGQHRHPLFLTPGDNDWFDCSAESAGGFDPLERLAALRSFYFADNVSHGGTRMPLVRQSAEFPENARWQHEGLVFATVHVIGPHNGFVRDEKLAAEAVARSRAGEAWVRESFRIARETKAPAIVLAFQADPWLTSAPVYEQGPLDWLRNSIGDEAAKFDGQVLVVHGDSHRLIVDTPYRRADVDAGTTRGMNVTRLQVPGWPDHRAVRIEVDPARPGVFAFQLVMDAEEAGGARP